jgi:hypothetical protein
LSEFEWLHKILFSSGCFDSVFHKVVDSLASLSLLQCSSFHVDPVQRGAAYPRDADRNKAGFIGLPHQERAAPAGLMSLGSWLSGHSDCVSPLGGGPAVPRANWSRAFLFRVALALEPLLVGGTQSAPSGVSVDCRA